MSLVKREVRNIYFHKKHRDNVTTLILLWSWQLIFHSQCFSTVKNLIARILWEHTTTFWWKVNIHRFPLFQTDKQLTGEGSWMDQGGFALLGKSMLAVFIHQLFLQKPGKCFWVVFFCSFPLIQRRLTIWNNFLAFLKWSVMLALLQWSETSVDHHDL